MSVLPVNIYQHDERVGRTGKHILIGEQAFCRCGLTTLFSPILQCSTLYTKITGIWNPVVMWYFNPFADKYEHTKPGPVHPNILEPTVERAIVEYIMFHEYFDEGILIEGLQTYLNQHTDLSALYAEAEYWHLPKSWVDHWIQEAIDDCDC